MLLANLAHVETRKQEAGSRSQPPVTSRCASSSSSARLFLALAQPARLLLARHALAHQHRIAEVELLIGHAGG